FVHNRLTGNYDVDEFGFDEELTESLVLPVLRVLYDKWFRVTTYGDENLPADGGALLVFNHSGTIPLDALMASVAVHEASGRHAAGGGARTGPGEPRTPTRVCPPTAGRCWSSTTRARSRSTR